MCKEFLSGESDTKTITQFLNGEIEWTPYFENQYLTFDSKSLAISKVLFLYFRTETVSHVVILNVVVYNEGNYIY